MFFQRAQSPHPSRLGGIQIFSDSEGRFLLFPVIRSRSGPSHILAAVKTLSPPLTAPELGTALLALWDRWEGTPCWEELLPELTAVPFWKGTARSYRAFFRAHRLIVAAFGHPNPGDISLAYWPRHLENNSWGCLLYTSDAADE